MTPTPLALRRNSANSHAALALQPRARMALRYAAVVCALLLPAAARAQSTAGSGMCSGMMTGTIGLAVPQGGGNFLTIPSSQITTGVFGIAECQCAETTGNPDINIEIKLTAALPGRHRRHRRDLGRRLELHQRHDAHLVEQHDVRKDRRRRRSRTSPSTPPPTPAAACTTSSRPTRSRSRSSTCAIPTRRAARCRRRRTASTSSSSPIPTARSPPAR